MGITPNSYFQTVVTQVLHRMTHQQRLMLATVSNGRSLAQMQNMMGMFVKTLPVVSEIAAEGITFATAAQTMHRQSIESMNRDFYPLTQMVERHGLRPEILYSFEGGIFDNVAAAFSPDTDIIVPALDTQKMPIVVTIYPDREGIFNIALSYDTALYSQGSMETLAEALVVYADHATCEGILVCDIEMTTDEQRETLKKLGCGEHLDFDHNDTLVSLFRRQAAATPDAIAVVFGDRRMTYSELDSLTDRLACRLINKYNVQPEEAVGVMIDRSELMVVYPLAIMKAGGCYLPLDYSFPTDRLQYMCQDAGVRLVLSEAQRVSEAMPDFNGNVLTNDVFATLPSCDIELPVVDAEQRYVLLYTSGSTGMPKGVALEHHNMVNYCHWYAKECRLSSVDHVMAYANFGFDAHMLDIFPTLSAGASVYILSSEIRMDLMAMNQYMEANAINVTFITTQIGYLFATTMDNKSLRLLTTGGEKLLPLKKPRFDMYNLYGPTEATIGPTYFKIDKDFDSSIIGGPIANVQLYVVDSDMCLVPKGVPGELIIGGAGVGRGYLHPAEKDAHIFFIYEGQRCYRTGDLVRWTDDDNLEFLGRIDNQVKLRGLRIEMGEIEACASRFEGIGQVAAQITNGQYICLYYTADAAVDVNALKQHLANRLAAYMIPTAYMQLDAMPLNTNGKIDRHQLPEPSTTVRTEGLPPRTEKDVVLLVIAQHVLGRDDFGITDDLFDLGLTSITAIKVAAMADASGVHISVNNLMRFRTIQQVFDAETPVGYWFNNYSPEKPVLIVPHGAVPVISMTEKFREWQNHFSIYTFEPADEHASRLSPDLDYDKLIMAYADLLDRDIPADAHVFGFLGYSWGGELGYSLAAQWQQRHGGKPQVYICDTFVYEPDDPKMTEEQILQVLVQYLMSHAADFDMSGLQTPEDGENGAVFNMTQMKFGKDASFAGEVLKIVTKKFYYSELYRHIQPLPIYDGHVTFFVATHENPRMTENLSRWKKVAPTMEIIEINDNHFNFSLRNKNTYLVTERLLDDLRHELRNKKSEE
jgi:amino acid adenylation domain-containing protein